MTTHELIERLNIGVTWSDGKPIGAVVGEVNDPVMRQAAQALSTLTDEVARLGSLNCPHCGERALSDDEIATLTKAEGTEA